MVECKPEALVHLESSKLRYYLRKAEKCLPDYIIVAPYGYDIQNYQGEPRTVNNCKYRAFHDSYYVFWDDTPDYAEELWQWWNRN